uniref:Tubulin tyrosine ligase-like family, member 2 n=1 Tax=Electrophorus electricus TaxID=8005 RepID=A0AAY5EJD0_ELEEL
GQDKFPGGGLSLVFRLNESTPEVLWEVLLERGWEEYDPLEQDEQDWNLYWCMSGFRNSDYENVLLWQRLNHLPKTMRLARKDWLARSLRRMRGTYGARLYGFSPMYTKLGADGKDIFIFDDIKNLTHDSPVIIQKYLSNPLLISGYKFDLRIYASVKSFCPLTIYMYQEGLVCFVSEKYNLASLDNLFSHLTNTSIDKFGPFYTTDKEQVGQGCTWTMSKFCSFLHSQGINEILLWQKINNIVTLTLLTIAPLIPSSPNCLELFGFDILIDCHYKPWLLEVSYSPALSMDCPAHIMVKKSLINDFIDLLNYTMIDGLRRRGYLRQKQRRPSNSGTRSLLPKSPIVRLIPKSVCESKWQCQSRINSYWHCSCSEGKLPAIHSQRVESPGQRTHDKNVPSLCVGDFILTFPFNDITHKASQGPLDVKTIVHKVRKLTS